MSASVPLFKDVWFKARRERRAIVATVMMANDSVARVKFGPRGGWRKVKT